MGPDIDYLHHVGHVVNDMEEAAALYRRLGFQLSPPMYAALPPTEGEAPQPIGPVNAHAELARNFVEVVTCVRPGSPVRIPGGRVQALNADAERLPYLIESLSHLTDTFAKWLASFQGVHILALHTPDAKAVARRLHAEGVRHGGANIVHLPVDTPEGPKVIDIHFLEIGEPPSIPLVPEGRIAVAESRTAPSVHDAQQVGHPNGAVDLVDVVLCVAEADLTATERRYEQYLGRPARTEGPTRVFALERSQITLVADSNLETILPGERAATLPAFVAYAVAVRDLGAVQNHLQENGVPLKTTASGDIFVPSVAALGAAVIFRATG